MERVKDISKAKIVDGNVLIQIYKKESKIILPNDVDAKDGFDYAIIIAVTDSIVDLEVGDYVLDFASSMAFPWDEFMFAVVPRHSVKLAVSPDNYDKDRKEKK